MTFRVVTFDIGGTLMAPYPSVGALYAEAFRRQGVNASPETVQAAFQASWHEASQRPKALVGADEHVQWWRDLVADAVRRVGRLSPVAGDRVFDELWERFADPASWRLVPHTREVLTEIRRRGYRTAVLSNWDQRLRPLLEKMALMPLFDAAFISCELGWEKPDHRIFGYAQQHLNETPDAILHVGDSAAHDRAGALAAGWHCLLIHEHGDIQELPQILALLPDRSLH